MGRLADAAFSVQSLMRSWEEVLAADREDGELSAGVRRFEQNHEQEIGLLNAELAWDSYAPGDLSEVRLYSAEKVRVLHVPTVRDRVVARAILDAVTPRVDPVLGPAAYGYRPGLGVADAVQQVARLRDEGHPWVLRTDVDDCFPSVPVGHATRLFTALVDDEQLVAVMNALLGRLTRSQRRGRRVVRGLPQGCPLSPILSNLVLADLDSDLMAEGFAVVRYADDIVVATESEADAWEACRVATNSLRRLNMTLGADETEVMSFNEGFTFLGEDFGPRYPPVLQDARVEEPQRKVLYAGTQGGRVRRQAGRIIIEDAGDRDLLDVPTGAVGRIVCFGSVGVSAGVRTWALANGVDVVFASRRGSYLGSFVSDPSGGRPQRVRAQIAFSDSPEALDLGRRIVEAKLRKQIVLL